MGLFSNTKRFDRGHEPRETLSRFKRYHARKKPEPVGDQGIDLRDGLTRMENNHVREPAALPLMICHHPLESDVSVVPAKSTALTIIPKTSKITIDALHRALPIRSAMLKDS